jgi:ribosomal protein L37E
VANHRKRKKPGSLSLTERQAVATCPACGKRAFTSKQTAKMAARSLFPGKRMRFYKCPDPDIMWWHMTSQNARRTAVMREFGQRPAQTLDGYLAWLEETPLDQMPPGEGT